MIDNDQKAATTPQARCPNCGYCPHCGRANADPVQPVPYIPYVPMWPNATPWLPMQPLQPFWTITNFGGHIAVDQGQAPLGGHIQTVTTGHLGGLSTLPNTTGCTSYTLS